MTTDQKRKLVQAAISGDSQPLKDYKANRPPLFTPERLEERLRYLSELLNRPVSEQEVLICWGRYDYERWETPDRLLIYRTLPNGLKIYLHYS